ncbi:chemotaxis protein CheB [Desulfococcaceae bacterium HSG8]|nr:chemotaxis protein CheB [Desulfococcaceae bacterium HSG8]
MKDTIKLLIVDDSKLMRRVITKIFDSADHIQVVGKATNGKEALELIPRLNPDVVTLDINMPVMDGLTALKHIMIRYPRPVVMLSTLTKEGATETFDALKYGAVDFIHKPSNTQPVSLEEQCQMVVRQVTLAAGVEIGSIRYLRTKSAKFQDAGGAKETKCDYICAVGASEGGYGTLLKIIPQLAPDLPAAVLVVLYEASRHVEAFARYLDDNCIFRVRRATDGESVEPGCCYLVSGKQYVTLHSFYGEYSLAINAAPFTTQKGGINMLMFSLAEIMKEHSVGVVLSGSGEDGAEGLEEILRMKGTAIVQEPRSCLYKEMAISAIDRCSPDIVIPDTEIAAKINQLVKRDEMSNA